MKYVRNWLYFDFCIIMVLGFVLYYDFFSASLFWCRILWALLVGFIAAFLSSLVTYRLEKMKLLESFENCFFALSYYMNSIKYESSVEEYLRWYRINSRLVKKLEQVIRRLVIYGDVLIFLCVKNILKELLNIVIIL